MCVVGFYFSSWFTVDVVRGLRGGMGGGQGGWGVVGVGWGGVTVTITMSMSGLVFEDDLGNWVLSPSVS